MRSTTKKMAVLIAVMTLFVAACGSASDKAAEQLAEELIEASGGGDVSVDVSGDGDDMTIEMETEDGSVSIGVGTELPDELDIPVPDGGDVMSSITSGEGVSVTLIYDHGQFDQIIGFYEEWTSNSGDEWNTQIMSVDAGEGTMRSTIFGSDSGVGVIIVGDCYLPDSQNDEFDAVCVTINQGE